MGQVPDEYLASLSVAERKASWVRIIAGSEWPSAGVLLLIDGDRVVGFVSFGASRDSRQIPKPERSWRSASSQRFGVRAVGDF
jgi:hypothetical protein